MIKYEGTLKKIEEATKRANEIVSNPRFSDMIRKEPKFTHTEVSPQKIAKDIYLFSFTTYVVTYSNIFTRANAYFTPSHPTLINLNSRKLGRSINSIVNTIVHEWVHVVDYHSNYDYGHAGNRVNQVKKLSAPYRIGQIAEQMAEEVWPTKKVIYHPPSRWVRFKRLLRRIFL